MSNAQGIVVPVQCPNPNCARCQQARQIQQNAKEKLRTLADKDPLLSRRLRDSVQDPQKYVTEKQAPTVLMIRDLPSQEVVTEYHPALKDYLTKTEDLTMANMLKEIHKAPPSLWIRNDTPTGSWAVLFLANQGRWNLQVWDQCPTVARWVDGLHSLLLDDCLFGNVLVSKIDKGTTIEPHCGSSNVRHRLQWTLQAAPGSSGACLLVGGDDQKRIEWNQAGDYFVFDDSYVHSVEYPSDNKNTAIDMEEKECRIVLIVDLWHPSLSSTEREVIRQLYPPG